MSSRRRIRDEGTAGRAGDDPFHFAGPVIEENARIARTAVLRDVLGALRRGRYVAVLAPHQSGKTTFLVELKAHLKRPVYVDFVGFRGSGANDILAFLRRKSGYAGTAESFEDFCRGLMRSGQVTFLLDELSAAGRAAVDLLHQWRGYHGMSLVARRPFHNLVLADSIDPLDLTFPDNPHSPFNIVEEFYLEDFDMEETCEFIRQRAGKRLSSRCIERVYAYTSGHPFLLQRLCSYLYRLPSGDADPAIEDLETLADQSGILEAANLQCVVRYFTGGGDRVRLETRLLTRILKGDRIRFDKADPHIKSLCLLCGCIRKIDGFCAIRNPLYEMALRRHIGEGRGHRALFVSYAHSEESAAAVKRICEVCADHGIDVIRDCDAIAYRQSISAFMKQLSRADRIIVVLSKLYFESQYCMTELTDIARRGGLRQRIFPVWLPDVDLGEETLVAYMSYWERKKSDLESKLKKISLTNTKGIQDKLRAYSTIRDRFDSLVHVVSDMKGATLKDLKRTNFREFIEVLNSRA